MDIFHYVSKGVTKQFSKIKTKFWELQRHFTEKALYNEKLSTAKASYNKNFHHITKPPKMKMIFTFYSV